jgi:hypothetical protein
LWHRAWKEHYSVAQREVVIGPHRADVRLQDGTVLELQHSPLSSAEIREREDFYGEMVWVLDARAWDLGYRKRVYVDSKDYGRETHDRFEVDFERVHERSKAPGDTGFLTWRRPKVSWRAAKAPIFLDIGEDWLIALRQFKDGFGPGLQCFGAFLTKQTFLTHCK